MYIHMHVSKFICLECVCMCVKTIYKIYIAGKLSA